MSTDLKTNDGSILIVVLAICALLSLSAVSTFYYTHKVTSLYTEEVHGNSSRIKAEALGLEKLLSYDNQEGDRFTSIVSQKNTGRTKIQREICLLSDISSNNIRTALFLVGSELNEPNRFPLVDYNYIFEQAVDCKLYQSLSTVNSGSGFRLSYGTSISSMVCRNQVPVSGQDLIIPANFEFLNDQLLVTETIIIAALGYIDINSSVFLVEDSLILAGGDLHIRELKVPLDKEPKITLVSATGAVVVDQIEGSPRLKISAWLGISLPTRQFSFVEEPLPYYQSFLTLGFCQ